MGEDAELGAGEAGGIHDAGMDQLVQDDDVVLAQQGADGAEGSGVAGGEAEGGLGALEGGERFVQFVMGRQRTADEARSARAGTVAFHGFDGRLFQGRVVGQAKVIVRGEIEQGPAPDLDAGDWANPRGAVRANRPCSRRAARRWVSSHSNLSFRSCRLLASALGAGRAAYGPLAVNHAGRNVAGML